RLFFIILRFNHSEVMEINENTSQVIYNKMAKLCSRSEQNSNEIKQKILASGLTSDEAEVIIDKLKKDKFIDDERYANSFVSDKFRLNKWGKVKIRHYLHLKGISDSLIQKALENLDETKYRQALVKTMKGKERTIKNKGK